MINKQMMGMILAALAANADSKSVTIPVTPLEVDQPMTPIQREVAEYMRLKATDLKEEESEQIDINLTLNVYEWLFVGPLYFGTPTQEASWSPGTPQFVYDTDSNFVAVTSSGCGDLCIQEYYIPEDSSSYRVVDDTEKTINFTTPMFAGDSIKVDTVKDRVCLDLEATNCVDDFVFNQILDEDVQSIIEDISGIFGLAEGTAEQPSYVDALYNANIIDDPVFTIALSTQDGV